MPLKLSGSKLFLLLAALSKEELEDLSRFLSMPLLNNGEALPALLNYCKTMHPRFPEELADKEKIHATLFPKEKFKEKRIRDLFSDLSLQVSDYLAWRAFSSDEGMKKIYLIREYQNRGLAEYANKEGARRLLELKASPGRSALQQLQKFQIKDLLFEDNETEEEYLNEAQKHLDHFFILAKLRLSTLLFSRRRYISGAQDIRFLEEIKQMDANEGLPGLERLYLAILGLLSGEIDQDVYLEARQTFFTMAPALAFEDRRVLFQSLINYTLRVISEIDHSFVSESWDLYMKGLETGAVFSERGELSDTTFTNIVINGAAIGQFEKAEQFILDYEKKLPREIRGNAVALGRAYLSYNQHSYERVIEMLRDVKYSSVPYALRGRSLLLRTYFDQAMRDKWRFSPEFYSHLEAFFKYVQRNKDLADTKKLGYLNLLSFTRTLAQVAGKGKTQKGLAKIRDDISKAQQVIAKDWLLKRAKLIEER
ncbi:MAG: hypothetical protein IPH04_11370 [Saprospirales bacterium]|nr:hypothetical protein [Saprospirales bacterium]